ncbi:MAG: channel protein TolC, partial [Betaproteobacteria bacterium HGW-Betaproteobacteria-6]
MKKNILVALLVVAVFPAFGQVSTSPATLKEVAQRAILNSPEVTSKWHAYRAADEETGVARGGYYPRVDLTAGAGRESLRQPTAADRDYTRSGVMLSLNQMLF